MSGVGSIGIRLVCTDSCSFMLQLTLVVYCAFPLSRSYSAVIENFKQWKTEGKSINMHGKVGVEHCRVLWMEYKWKCEHKCCTRGRLGRDTRCGDRLQREPPIHQDEPRWTSALWGETLGHKDQGLCHQTWTLSHMWPLWGSFLALASSHATGGKTSSRNGKTFSHHQPGWMWE